jgi:hypothetical protein
MVQSVLGPALAGSSIARIGALALLVVAGLTVYALLVLVLGVADWRGLLGRLRRQPA